MIFVYFSIVLSCAILSPRYRRIPAKVAAPAGGEKFVPVSNTEAGAWVATIGALLVLHLVISTPAWIYLLRFETVEFDRIPLVLIGAVGSFLIAGWLTCALYQSHRMWRPDIDQVVEKRFWGGRLGVGFYFIAGWLLFLLLPLGLTSHAIVVQRMANPQSGVSPLLPAAAFAGVILLASYCHLAAFNDWRRNPFGLPTLSYDGHDKRQAYCQLAKVFSYISTQKDRILCPFRVPPEDKPIVLDTEGGSDRQSRSVANAEKSHAFRLPGHRDSKHFLGGSFLLAGYFVTCRWIAPAETWGMQSLLSMLALAAISALLITLNELIDMCAGFRRVLKELGRHPIVDAFSALPEKMAVGMIDFVVWTREPGGDRPEIIYALRRLDKRCPDCECGVLHKIYQSSIDQRSARIFNRQIAYAVSLVARNLIDYWEQKRIKQVPEKKADDDKSAKDTNTDTEFEREGEYFVAAVLANIIRKMALHVHRLMIYLFFEILLLLWAFDSYPFQPKSALNLGYFVFIIAAALYLGRQLLAFNADEVLSRLSKTTPNQLTWDPALLTTLFTYVFLPLTWLAITQVPALGELMSGIAAAFSKSSGG